MRALAFAHIAALCSALCVPVAARAQAFSPPSVEFRRDADGSIAHERIRNTTLRTVPRGDDDAMLLVVEQDEWMENAEIHNSVRVRAQGWDGSAFTRPLWAREERADAWELVPVGYLRLTSIVCCGAVTTHTLYHLETGREVAWHTSEPLTVVDLRARTLLVLYESSWSVRAPKGAQRNEVQGMLRIVRGTEVTDQVLVTGRDRNAIEEWPELRAAFCDEQGRPRLRQVSGEKDGDITFDACFELKGGGWIVLPVRGGRCVLESARFPAGITARRGGW
jgi:hypothetical protein